MGRIKQIGERALTKRKRHSLSLVGLASRRRHAQPEPVTWRPHGFPHPWRRFLTSGKTSKWKAVLSISFSRCFYGVDYHLGHV